MKRREFIAALGGAAASTSLWPLVARAQQPAMPVIGFLSARSSESDVSMVSEFYRGLKDAGYVVDKNVAIEFRWGDGHYDRLPALAEDLVRGNVAVIVTAGGEISARAAKAATGKIPIVFNVGEDPVKYGLVASLNRPGGNVTGVTSLLGTLGTKQLGLLRDLVPKAGVIAMLVNPDDTWAEAQIANTEAAALAVGQQLVVFRASTEPDIDAAFAAIVQQRAGALLVATSPFFVTRANYLIALATRHALPAIYFRREIADAGGLMSYGSSTAELYGQMGTYAGKILNGASPADLPVMQAIKFELVINLKTAKALGLEIPPTLLARADEVIE
jgi:putative tryptophan/tyrosine transport system substrate-binding protein